MWQKKGESASEKVAIARINRLTVQPIHRPLSAAVRQRVAVGFTWCTLVGLDPRLNFDLVC